MLTYLKDRDPKIRFIAAAAIENVVHAYPGATVSHHGIVNIDTDGHRDMVRRFVDKIEKLRADATCDSPIAVGPWSEPVAHRAPGQGGTQVLRGRLLIAEGRLLGDSKTRETVMYVELQNVSEAVGLNIYFENKLRCELPACTRAGRCHLR